LQLRATALAVVCLLLRGAAPVWADVEAASRVTFFREPGNSNEGVTVVHPQTDVNAVLGESLSIGAGYEVDMVSGATPAIYSAQSGVDAISGATKFDDFRQAARAALGWNTNTVGVNAAYSYGWESDYRSHTLQVGAKGDFLERNFTLGLAYTRNLDEVCDQNNEAAQGLLDLKPLVSSATCFQTGQRTTVTRKVDIDTLEPSLTWTATPKLLLQFGATLQLLDGFQSSPYRRVVVNFQGQAPQERLPEQRQRYALFVRGNWAFPSIRGALSMGARAYRDSWDLWSGTLDTWFNKYLASKILVTLRGRYHKQTGAVFFRSGPDLEIKGPTGEYWTGDRELAPMDTILAGFKLAYISKRGQEQQAFLEEVEINAKFDGLIYNLDANAPNADRPYALIAQLGAALRF
jgi:hypothetical protein